MIPRLSFEDGEARQFLVRAGMGLTRASSLLSEDDEMAGGEHDWPYP